MNQHELDRGMSGPSRQLQSSCDDTTYYHATELTVPGRNSLLISISIDPDKEIL